MVFSDGKVSLRRWCCEWIAFFGLCALVVLGIHVLATDAARSAAKHDDELIYRISVVGALTATSAGSERIDVRHPTDPNRVTVVIDGKVVVETTTH